MRVVRCRLPVEQGDFALIRPADWSGSIAIAGLVGLWLLARIGIGTGPGPAWVKLIGHTAMIPFGVLWIAIARHTQ